MKSIFITIFAGLFLFVSLSVSTAQVCPPGNVESDVGVIEFLHSRFQQDDIYAFLGEDYDIITAALDAVAGTTSDWSPANELYVSTGPSDGGGAALVFFNDDCFHSNNVVPVEFFEAALGVAYPDGIDPVFHGGDGV